MLRLIYHMRLLAKITRVITITIIHVNHA